MEIHGPILAATALGSPSDEALRQAHDIAEAHGQPLKSVHVLPEISRIRPLFPELHRLEHEQSRRTGEVALSALAAQWTRVLGHPAPEGAMILESGSPHSAVVRLADQLRAGLIVVGSGSHAAGASLGGVGERIVRDAHCPVLIALPSRAGPVLAATDFSDPGLPAVQWGDAEARRRAKPLTIVHAVDPYVAQVASPELSLPDVSLQLIEARREDGRKRLDLASDSWRPTGGSLLLEGPAHDAIVAAASQHDADLVVIGTHGRTGLSRLALGSVAEGVVRRTACSVLVVRLHTGRG